MMEFLTLLLLLTIVYFGLIIGVPFCTISIEELLPGRKWFYWIKKILISIIVFLLCNSFFLFSGGMLLSIVLGVLIWKVKFSNQVIFATVPVFLYLYLSNLDLLALFSGMFFILSIVISSEYCSEFVNKNNHRKLSVSRKEIVKKIIKSTNLFFISSVLFLIISLL